MTPDQPSYEATIRLQTLGTPQGHFHESPFILLYIYNPIDCIKWSQCWAPAGKRQGKCPMEASPAASICGMPAAKNIWLLSQKMCHPEAAGPQLPELELFSFGAHRSVTVLGALIGHLHQLSACGAATAVAR